MLLLQLCIIISLLVDPYSVDLKGQSKGDYSRGRIATGVSSGATHLLRGLYTETGSPAKAGWIEPHNCPIEYQPIDWVLATALAGVGESASAWSSSWRRGTSREIWRSWHMAPGETAFRYRYSIRSPQAVVMGIVPFRSRGVV